MEKPGLVRAIGRWDLTAAVVNAIIGSAVFTLPSALVKLSGPDSARIVLLAGLGNAFIVLCFAEVASRFRDAGGPYLYARDAFGPSVGFMAGWMVLWTRVLSVAAGLNAFVNYLVPLLPAAKTAEGRALAMVAVVATIAVLNIRGVRQATWAVDAFTVAKLLPLFLLIALGLPRIRPEVAAAQTAATPDLAGAVLLLAFAYGGFDSALIPAGEAKNPRRDTAFALLAAIGLITLIYLLVQVTVVGLLPNAGAETAPFAAALAALLGPAGAVLASVTVLVSVYGYVTGNVLQSPRLLFAMAERGELPASLAAVHERFRTPHVSVLALATVALALAVTGTFTLNAQLSAIVRLVMYLMTIGALVVFRRREGTSPAGASAEEAGFRLPGVGLIAVPAAGFCLWLLSTRSRAEALALLALAGLGFVLFAVSRAAARRSREAGNGRTMGSG